MSRRGWRRAAIALAAIVVVNLGLALLGSLTREPGGPASSSYATQPLGFAAWAELLASSGHRVERLREAPSDRSLDAGATVVVLDPRAVSPAQRRALERFVRAGGHLVAGGDGPAWFGPLIRPGLRRQRVALSDVGVLAPAPEVQGVTRVDARAGAGWTSAGAALPVLGRPRRALVVVGAVGRGRVALVSDAAPLRNRLLGRRDNAALALSLAGGRGRPVLFAESYHGFGPAQGLAALPLSWRLALAGLGLAALVWVAAHLRRLGPPQDEERGLPPPRRAYVDALAATLARTNDPQQASQPVQAAARARLARRTGLDVPAAAPELRAAARRLGLSEEEARALSEPAAGDADVMAAGRALARLGEDGRR